MTETEVILNDAVDGYIHNFTLHYTISPDETTDLTYTFGEQYFYSSFSPYNITSLIYLHTIDKKNFQIQFGPVDYCLNWGVSC